MGVDVLRLALRFSQHCAWDGPAQARINTQHTVAATKDRGVTHINFARQPAQIAHAGDATLFAFNSAPTCSN